MKSIKEMIENANTELEIQFFLNYGNLTKPSGRIRRDWLRLAKAKRQQLKEETSKGIRLIT